ncbi:MAG: PPOX class F420-dependent oxidoreductase [Actinobacteria bacterium]|nr:MAG: PPOX class F420-dependent oxidoreductase [Actinomycetota bacterium]
MAELSENARKKIEEPNFGYLATVMEDGSPQVSPVWRNVRRDPRVAISVADRENQYDKIDVRGRVVDMIEGDEAEQHIDKMAKKYLGQDTYPWKAADERRVLLKIEPESVSEMRD